jgi:hypothetical protein
MLKSKSEVPDAESPNDDPSLVGTPFIQSQHRQ